jgi:hypothetical protein
MTIQVFDEEGRAAFARLYPEEAGLVTHRLTGHPLFELDALVRLAGRMRPDTVEQNLADLPIGVEPDAVQENGLSVADTIRSIERNGSWMVLKSVEQNPEYRALLDAILDEIEPLVAPRTGAMLKREGFIFVSSPGAVTPFHFDPEHNILLQMRGVKTMTVFPASDDGPAGPELHERFHMGGHRNLPYHDRFAPQGTAHQLSPGEAIHIPVKAPHWVKNGPEPSVSFSVTWRSEWSYREADAHGFNHLTRQAGITPTAPGRFPRQNRAKSLAYRVIGRAKRALDRT